MATIKAFTSLEQSKKLAEILPLESADMWYEDNGIMITRLGHMPKEYTDTEVPCWSLAALLIVLPRPSLHQDRDKKWYCDVELNRLYFSSHYDNPLDACYEMILKLHELNLL